MFHDQTGARRACPAPTHCRTTLNTPSMLQHANSELSIGARPLSADLCENMARDISIWASIALASGQLDDADADSRAAEQTIITLRTWASDLWASAGLLPPIGQGNRFKHESEKLINCIGLASHLKGGAGSLVNVLSRSLALAAPRGRRCRWAPCPEPPTPSSSSSSGSGRTVP